MGLRSSKQVIIEDMEIEVQEEGAAPELLSTPLESLDWSRFSRVLQDLVPGRVPTGQDAGFFAESAKQVLSAKKRSDKIGTLARRWSQEQLVHLALAQRVQVAFALEHWLAPQLDPGPRGELKAGTSALVCALCEAQDKERALQDNRRSRLVLVGQLFASIAHELRNPLAVMESSVFLLRRQLPGDLEANAPEGSGPASIRHLQKIARNVTRCHEIIHEVLEMIRDAPLRTQRVGVKDLWLEVQSQSQPASGVTWELAASPDLRVSCEPRLMRQCLLNLVNNAQVAMSGQGHLYCESRRSEQGELVFEIRDTGPGFSAAWLAQGVQCLASEHPNGHGLGLALAQSIAQRHEGRLELSNHPEGGAVVRVYIPGQL